MTNRHHRFDYIELPATDLAASTRFYAEAFGWSFVDYGPQYAGIAGDDGGPEAGGITTFVTPQPAPGGPLVLLFSDDLDASVAAVEQAGGTIVNPPTVFPGGRRFAFADPAGVVLGVWAEK